MQFNKVEICGVDTSRLTVLKEKEKIQLLIEEAKKNNVYLCGIFQSRFQDAPRLFKKAVEEGRFGKITLADAQFKWYRTQEYYDSGAWRGTWEVDGGGVFMNQGIHAIDLLLFILGEDPVEISAYTAALAHERIDTIRQNFCCIDLRVGGKPCFQHFFESC